jgi:hypothetical protein
MGAPSTVTPSEVPSSGLASTISCSASSPISSPSRSKSVAMMMSSASLATFLIALTTFLSVACLMSGASIRSRGLICCQLL